MAVYRIKVNGEASDQLIKAKTRAQAISGIVEVEALSADEVADAVANGATVKVAGQPGKTGASEN